MILFFSSGSGALSTTRLLGILVCLSITFASFMKLRIAHVGNDLILFSDIPKNYVRLRISTYPGPPTKFLDQAKF